MAAPRIIDYGRMDDALRDRLPEMKYKAGVTSSADLPKGCEADILAMFKATARSDFPEPRIPMSKLDTFVYEMSFRFGRADIVIFHIDGSASVIEVKDGSKGYNHVVAGIGQASLYAAQIGMSKSGLTEVRKCLLWTSTGSVAADALIEDACIQSGTVPMPWGLLGDHLAAAGMISIGR